MDIWGLLEWLVSLHKAFDKVKNAEAPPEGEGFLPALYGAVSGLLDDAETQLFELFSCGEFSKDGNTAERQRRRLLEALALLGEAEAEKGI